MSLDALAALLPDLTVGGWLLLGMGVLDLLVLLALAGVSARRTRREKRGAWIRSFMRVAFPAAAVGEVVRVIQHDPDAFIHEYMDLADSVSLSHEQRTKVREAFVQAHVFPVLLKQLRSRRKSLRIRAAVWLGFASPEQAVGPLAATLAKEESLSVRLHLSFSLARLKDPAVIPTMVDTLAGSPLSYQRRVVSLLMEFGDDLTFYFDILRSRREPEIRRLLADIAARRGDSVGQEYLSSLLDASEVDMRRHAARLLLAHYIQSIETDALLQHPDLMIVNLTLEAMGRLQSEGVLDTLAEHAARDETRKSAVLGLTRFVRDAPRMHAALLERIAAHDQDATDPLLEVIAQRVEYLVERLLNGNDSAASEVLNRLVRTGRVSGIIAFLNRNRDPATESLIVDSIRASVSHTPEVRRQFALYAADSVIDRLGVVRETVEQRRGERVGEAVRPLFVLGILFVTTVGPIAGFVLARMFASAGSGPIAVPALSWAADYITGFEVFFSVYAFVLNLFYLTLLVFAAVAVRRQEAAMRLKPLSMLFQREMLPSISVVVPAFREESTIVENVNSLLNLRYPDFEVIVVNDGSPDDTLPVLIRHFELERSDVFIHGYLDTQPVRGVYRNPRIPELLVIDKQNGGKADSLNAGINASRKEYFAAIDSDSLLERDSLLRLTALFLESDDPVVATGGNIFPVNGCRVDRGALDEVRLPRQLLGRLQTLEYIRSFMAGRTGWAQLGSLMIISGAFGLFDKRAVVDAHGYLTSKGHFGRDTVAEDMELVVRVSRMLRERGEAFAVQYAFSANCWTEVPVTRKVLVSQRDRWQRGLIDTMFSHIRVLFNPRHGNMGLVGFPYFFIFELLGPWVEVQALLFVVIGLVTGTLPAAVFAAVFAVTVPMGVAVSLSSLLLAEYHRRYFTRGDRARLISLAILENFGYRQYASLIRLRGYLSVLSRKTGWGTMVRSGFRAGAPATGSGERSK